MNMSAVGHMDLLTAGIADERMSIIARVHRHARWHLQQRRQEWRRRSGWQVHGINGSLLQVLVPKGSILVRTRENVSQALGRQTDALSRFRVCRQ